MKKCSSGGKPKKQHPNREEAEKQRRSLIEIGVWTWSGSNTYACNCCGFFHAGRVGSVNRGGGRKGRAKNLRPTLHTQ